MGERSLHALRQDGCVGHGRTAAPWSSQSIGRSECLEQLLQAFEDLTERDDIHQAAARLDLVQHWIREEAAKAADDPLFADLVPS